MTVAAVVGAQWGDEGKGKVVDFLAEKADLVVRFNGGDNAGHTVEFSGRKFKMHAVPSGSFRDGKRVVIAAGCAVNPKTLVEELDMLARGGIKPRLLLDARAHAVTPYHVELDALQDARKGAGAVGTTKRGIGPCYADKALRIGLRFADFLDDSALRARISFLHALKVREMECVYGASFRRSEEDVFGEYSSYAARLKPFIGDACAEVNDAIAEGRNVLLEGAQGALLGLDHGLYPYCTSSDPTSGGAAAGAGIAPSRITEVLGVVKAYVSRVGEGPVPTEIGGAAATEIRDKGGEYGTTTGRPRRIGWLDLVALRHAHELNGFTSLAFTRIDTLSGIAPLKVCVAYELGGKALSRPPISAADLARCKPVYEEADGWEDLGGEGWREAARKGMGAMPKEAKEYVSRVVGHLGVPAAMVSVGPSREDTIIIKDVFAK
jgi:adenylosuccinate synthase